MKNKDFKKFIDHEIENQNVPDFNIFMKKIPVDEVTDQMNIKKYNFALNSLLAAITIMIIGSSLIYQSPYDKRMKELCQQYGCDFKVKKQAHKLKSYIIKYKKFLKEEA